MLCQNCNKNKATQKHHLFSNTKLNRKLYGALLDSKENIMDICEACHLWKAIPKLSEIEFCRRLGIEPRSKTGKEIWERMEK